SLRWYPGAVAATLASLGHKYALPLQFVLLYFPLVLLFGVSYHYLRTLAGVSGGLALLGASAVLLNVNLVNVLCEGQHAQVFGGPFFFLLLGQLFLSRNSPAGAAGWPEFAFTGLLATVVLCSFPELIFLTGVLTFLVAC